MLGLQELDKEVDGSHLLRLDSVIQLLLQMLVFLNFLVQHLSDRQNLVLKLFIFVHFLVVVAHHDADLVLFLLSGLLGGFPIL